MSYPPTDTAAAPAGKLLHHLNAEQLAAVTLPAQPALILAGAGSGKTRVLTTRIAWLLQTGQVSPGGVLAVTFTNKAAKEMLARLSNMLPVNVRGMWIGTFHGLCNRFLRAHWKLAGAAAELPDPGHAGFAQRHQAHHQGDEPGRGPLRPQAGELVHRRLQGRRPAAARRGDPRRADAQAGRDLPGLRRPVPARRRGRLRRADAAHLRAAARQRPAARALPAPFPPCAGRRIPGHQPAAVRVAEDVRAARPRGPWRDAGRVRRRRRRPEHLCLPRCQGRQHGRLRARVPRQEDHQAGAELPQLRQHPRRRQRADRAQRATPGQEPAHRGRPGRAGAGVRIDQRFRRGAVASGRSAGAAPQRPAAQRDRAAVPQQRPEPGAGKRAVQCRHSVPCLRRAALFRARRGQACAGLPAADREPERRHQLPARGQLSHARHRRAHARAAAGRGAGQRPQPVPERGRGGGQGRCQSAWPSPRWSTRCATPPAA